MMPLLDTGIHALVESGYPAKLVEKAVKETPGLQPPALRVSEAGSKRHIGGECTSHTDHPSPS